MASKLTVLLVLSLAVLVAAKSQTKVTSGLDWDYIEVVRRWPGTIAYGQPVPSNISDFTLHGLWPTRNDGSYPSYCNSQSFDVSLLDSILDDLIVAWYDYDGSQLCCGLWDHEWPKHGTCAEEITALNSELKFFSYGVAIVNKMNITNALESAGIVPSTSQTYDLGQISSTLQSAFGYAPNMECQDTDLGNSLLRVNFCVSPSLSLQDCPSNSARKVRRDGAEPSPCSQGSVYLPPITY